MTPSANSTGWVHLLLGAFAYDLLPRKLRPLQQEIDDFAYLGEPTDF